MISLSWRENILTIADPRIGTRTLDVWYLEAFCRDHSANQAWEQTVIPHRTTGISANDHQLHLRSFLSDGVVVDHQIDAAEDEISFKLDVHSPASTPSRAHWAQPCIRVAEFVGVKAKRESEEYLPKCFVFIDGRERRMPTEPWNRRALYSPGQVWRPPQVDAADLNPRPLNAHTPSNGLIGCYSWNDRLILATAWEPYQELFQGVFCCLHSDFRIGGLAPGERKSIRGKIYLVDADMPALLRRYGRDFPEHQKQTQ